MFKATPRSIDQWLAAALGAVLGFSSAAALALALLLAGHGAVFLGPGVGATLVSGFLISAGAAGAIGFARSISAALGAGRRVFGNADNQSESRGEDAVARWLLIAIGVALGLFLAAVLAQNLRAPDGAWDAFSIWNARARTLLRTAGDVRFAVAPERGQALFTLHPDYPLLLPTAIALGWRLLGTETALWPALLSLLPALLTVLIAALLVARESRRRAAWVAALLLTTPEFASMAGAQYAEAMLGALVLAGAGLMLLAWQARDGFNARLLAMAGAALGLAASVKHEGMLAFAFGLLVLARRPRELVPFLLGALLPLLLFAWFAHAFAPPGDLAPGGIGALVHRALLPRRLGQILLGLGRRIVYVQLWGIHLAAFAVALIVQWRRGAISPAASPFGRRLLFFAALLLAGFLTAYLTTPHPLEWHLRTSIDRLLLQLWPLAVVGLALSTSNDRSNNVTFVLKT